MQMQNFKYFEFLYFSFRSPENFFMALVQCTMAGSI